MSHTLGHILRRRSDKTEGQDKVTYSRMWEDSRCKSMWEDATWEDKLLDKEISTTYVQPRTCTQKTKAHAHAHASTNAPTRPRTHASMHARIHPRTPASPPARTHAHMHTCTHARTHARIHARTHARTHVLTHACTHASKYARMHAYRIKPNLAPKKSSNDGSLYQIIPGCCIFCVFGTERERDRDKGGERHRDGEWYVASYIGICIYRCTSHICMHTLTHTNTHSLFLTHTQARAHTHIDTDR